MITDQITLTAREADFLRLMARHCIATRMPGAHACQILIDVLDQAGIPARPAEPDYGLFEDPSRTPSWIKE